MISLLNTYWFWGLLTFLIPLLIHLFNRERFVKKSLGSIKHLETIERPQPLQIQLKNYWQLFLRSLLLTALCLLLVQLIWKKDSLPKSSPISSLLFISPDIQNSPTLSAALDSLTNEDKNNLYFLAPNFPKWNENTTLKSNDHWQLLAQLNELDKTTKKYVFLDQLQKNYQSERPNIQDNIEIHFIEGEEEWQAKMPLNNTEKIRIQIIQEKAQQADTKYVMAALKAIQAQNKSIEIANTQLLKEANTKADFYFILSDQALPDFLNQAHQNGSHIFQYAPNSNSDKSTKSKLFLPTTTIDFEYPLAPNSKSETLLKNAFNQAVLSAEKNTSMHYFLHTQFLTTHTNWMTQSHFPTFIQQLLNHHWTNKQANTNLAIDSKQIMPNIISNHQPTIHTPISETQNAHYYLATLLILLFLLERAYAFSNQPKKS